MRGLSTESLEHNTSTLVHQDSTVVAKNATKFGRTKASSILWNKLTSSTRRLAKEL